MILRLSFCRLILLLVFTLFYCCCTKSVMPPEVSLKQLFKLSEEQKDSIAVLVCDYRQFNRLKHMSYGNFMRVH